MDRQLEFDLRRKSVVEHIELIRLRYTHNECAEVVTILKKILTEIPVMQEAS